MSSTSTPAAMPSASADANDNTQHTSDQAASRVAEADAQESIRGEKGAGSSAAAAMESSNGQGLTSNPWADSARPEDSDAFTFNRSEDLTSPSHLEPDDKPALEDVPDHEDIHGTIAPAMQQMSLRNDTHKADEVEEQLSEKEPAQTSSPPPLPPKDARYLPTPPKEREKTNEQIEAAYPSASQTQIWDEKGASRPPAPLDTAFSEKKQEEESANDSKSEIQSIMDQFEGGQGDQSLEDVMSPRLHKTGTNLSVFQYPPRKSSLENLSRLASDGQQDSEADPESSSPHAREGSISSTKTRDTEKNAPSFVSQPPPPEPDPEPDLPFDFHRFLEQLRHRTADPVARFLRSFLMEFGKKQWMVHEQVKIISDFLLFIGNRMAQCEVWRTVSEAEFDNAKEGMEKLVMNRLYTQTFSPEIPPPEPVASKPRRRGATSPIGAGRKGQHQEDVERDDVLAQKVRIYGWIREEHLDMKPFSDKGRKFLRLAQQELSKIKAYRAPRDKVICVLNCCKVIFGFLRNAHSDQSADSFIPLLIYTLLKANPDHLVSNLQYILRFRNQDKLGGEAGYYISSLMGAVQFIENLDRTNLTISDEDFEREVEASVSAIAERQQPNEKPFAPSTSPPMPHFSEKSTLSRPEVTPRNSMDAEQSSPRRGAGAVGSVGGSVDDADENIAVAGLLRTIQKPLSTIGRIFSEDSSSTTQSRVGAGIPHQPALTPQPGSTPTGMSPVPRQRSSDGVRSGQGTAAASSTLPGSGRNVHVFEPGNALLPPGSQQRQPQQSNDDELRARMAAEDAAARQASAEAAEAHRVEQEQHATVVETLKGMFPGLDVDVISDVVRMKEGRVGLAVDACLALSH